MIFKTSDSDVRYLYYLKELRSLLKKSGITPSRQFITASVNRNENRTGAGHEVQTRIGQVVIYMQEHLSESLSLGKLAEEVNLNKYQLIRDFCEKMGTTPWKYLISERIDKAKELLEEGTPPGQVAAETGFYDQPHLNKTFREETGRTPKEYQEENFKNRN